MKKNKKEEVSEATIIAQKLDEIFTKRGWTRVESHKTGSVITSSSRPLINSKKVSKDDSIDKEK